jgi:acyl-coenzyme A thioesterase PaaI-like protein
MKLAEVVAAARSSGDWAPLVNQIPYARFLGMSIDVKGDVFSCTLPFDRKLIGNPILPALHGGAIGGFMESTGLFYLLWHMDSSELPKIIDFSFDFLRSGRPENVYANVFMVKQGQRVAHLRIEAWQSSPDKPIAIGHGNFMLKQAKPLKGTP